MIDLEQFFSRLDQYVRGFVRGADYNDGWLDVGDTWTYASATTFTVDVDKTSMLQAWTKIRLTQTTVKYFWVVSAVLGVDGRTTVTVTGGGTYSLANAAITDPQISYQLNPQGWPLPVWDDLRVSAETTKVGSASPDFDTFLTSMRVYYFDKTTIQYVHFSVQMPHNYKAGTAITPHAHWTPKTTADGTPANQKVVWGLAFGWANIGEVFAESAWIYAKDHTPADANVVANKQYMSAFPEITPSAIQGGISSMLICTLFRIADDADDTYEDDAGLLEIDFHYQIDSDGSREITTK